LRAGRQVNRSSASSRARSPRRRASRGSATTIASGPAARRDGPAGEEAGLTVPYYFSESAKPTADHESAAGHLLDRRQAEQLADLAVAPVAGDLNRRQTDGSGLPVVPGDLGVIRLGYKADPAAAGETGEQLRVARLGGPRVMSPVPTTVSGTSGGRRGSAVRRPCVG
jgi:hypothetical protein